ncbi:variable surface protein [Plasmodium gonderi]|uniref:Variable surface protein n=1 Tax=Plasmodium gonderi TaxID=77519 RepID=A0A1Y1JUA7_PLAGO|nr:variable surface protein [Plasmodium gonderi]GAW83993.1 variable surface protein [Plasmodium gonderi]
MCQCKRIIFSKNPFTDKCCHEAFFQAPVEVKNFILEDHGDIVRTNDPILISIAAYLIENINKAKTLCALHSSNDEYESYQKVCNKLCDYLNKWLNEKCAIYTFSGNCHNNKEKWNKYIEKLWILLKKVDHSKNWCERKTRVYSLEFPNNLIPDICNNNNISLSLSNFDDKAKIQQIVHSSLSSKTYYISSSSAIGYTIFGIIIIIIILYNVIQIIQLFPFSPENSRIRKIMREGKSALRNIYNKLTQEIYKPYINYDKLSETTGFNVLYNNFKSRNI